MSDARRGLTRPTEQETDRVYKLQTGTGEEGPDRVDSDTGIRSTRGDERSRNQTDTRSEDQLTFGFTSANGNCCLARAQLSVNELARDMINIKRAQDSWGV